MSEEKNIKMLSGNDSRRGRKPVVLTDEERKAKKRYRLDYLNEKQKARNRIKVEDYKRLQEMEKDYIALKAKLAELVKS
jgi:hypothetical protein